MREGSQVAYCGTREQGTGIEITHKYHLDALLLTLMQAERFGARPPFPRGESFVLETSAPDHDRGFPPFIVAGVSVQHQSPRDLHAEAAIFLIAALRAIDRFNSEHSTKIFRIGVLADNLLARELGERAVIDILSRNLK
ncbi:MAG TPA: hypothetical protein VHW00_14850 [Thermoanaerobaculia bacterium]|nr:hypothetical protein [Thermoanaerobaculia bacterium]